MLARMLLIGVALGACACGGRANPQVTKIVRTQSQSQTTTTIAYDSDRHPTTVTADNGDTLALSFEGSKLRKLDTTSSDGNSRTDFLYDGERLTRAATDLANGGGSRTIDVAYDGGGHVVSLKEHDQSGAFASDVSTTFARNGDGLSAVELGDIHFTLVHKDGALSSITSVDAQQATTTSTITTQEGRVDRFDTVFTDGTHGATTYDYDDAGRIARVLQTHDGDDDVDVALTYDDGADAVDVDVTPFDASSFFFAWDLKGASSSDVDVRTELVRFLGAFW